VARRLSNAVPNGAFHARLGGDEFGILLLGLHSIASIEKTARLLLSEIRLPVEVDGVNVQVSGTFGSATFPTDGSAIEDLMKAADMALYAAKRSARNSVIRFYPAIQGLFDQKCRAIALVDAALNEGRIVPFYQPRVNLADGTIQGFEALVRVKTSDGAILGPSYFEQALQDPATAFLIGLRMLELVTADLASWRNEGFRLVPVSLNVAESDLTSGDLADRILSRLKVLELSPSLLEIEVVESVIFDKDAEVIECIVVPSA
jgi:predicted signal transduction protein with EAL and GGDEF domain